MSQFSGKQYNHSQHNPYIPMQAEIVDIDVESPNTYLISLKLLDEMDFSYAPGQFVMVSVMGLESVPFQLPPRPPETCSSYALDGPGRSPMG